MEANILKSTFIKIFLFGHKIQNFRDSEFVLKDAKVWGLAEYPQKNRTTDHTLLIRYYKGIGRHWLMKIYETYKPDFDLFGYEIPSYLLSIQ